MSITDNIKQVLTQIENEHRPVCLLAVSKGQSLAKIEEAITAGLTHFGENYVQEALPKIAALSKYTLTWHFIGPIQSNKAKAIATHFQWVQSVDRLNVAKKLNDCRPTHLPPLNVCIQVNIDNESSKSGVMPDDLLPLATAILQCPKLKLRGIMAIPAPKTSADEACKTFMVLNHLMAQLSAALNYPLDTLSMGMSDDYIPALKAGATLIRLGSCLFGAREGLY